MRNEVNSVRKELMHHLKVMVGTVLVTMVLLHFVQVSLVSGVSMLPNYRDGCIICVDKTFYDLEDCQYGDVIVLNIRMGDKKQQIIKRVIGLPGDVLFCSDDVVYRNGEALNESYILESMDDFDWNVQVPEGAVFVMGDNRNNSSDSREFGSFDFEKTVVGKVFLKLF